MYAGNKNRSWEDEKAEEFLLRWRVSNNPVTEYICYENRAGEYLESEEDRQEGRGLPENDK